MVERVFTVLQTKFGKLAFELSNVNIEVKYSLRQLALFSSVYWNVSKR